MLCFFSEGLCGLDPKPVKHGALPAAHGPGSLCLAEAHTSEASRRRPRPGLGAAVGGPDVMRASQSQKDEHSSPHAQCLKVSDS